MASNSKHDAVQNPNFQRPPFKNTALSVPDLKRDDVELLKRETLHQGFFRLEALELRHRLFEGGWSEPMRREVHNRFDAVGVLLYDPERDSLVLMEEAGCKVAQLTKLHTYYPSPGACSEQVTLFCGLVDTQGLGGIHGLDEEHEDIRVHVMPFANAWELLEKGRLDNAMCLIGLHWLNSQRASLRAASQRALTQSETDEE